MEACRTDRGSQPLHSLKESKQAQQAAKGEGKGAPLSPHTQARRGRAGQISAEDQEPEWAIAHRRQQGEDADPGLDTGSSGS